jgi:predicted nucleotide-binding protein
MQQKTENAPDPRNVFIVHGRNLEAYNELASFLSALDLHPIDWSEAVSFTREGSPYIGTVLDTAFSNAQAVVVLFTPDDEARLRKLYRKTDETREASLIPQPRPNVIFEAGMAFGRYPERTILVELGELRGFSDTEGRHAIRLNDSAPTRNDLAQRLESAGCRVNTKGDRWLKAGNFSDSIVNISYTEEPSLESDWSKSYHTLWLILDLSFAETMIMNHEALDSVEVTQDKLRRAYEHASQVGLIETEPGRQLAKLVEQANSTFATEWTPQKRDYFHRQIDICRNASLKLIETYHESAV